MKFVLKSKRVCLVLVFVCLLGFGIVKYTHSDSQLSDIRYNDATNIIQEVMRSYYIRGPFIQYNSAKASYGKVSPEDITSQDTKYDVCAAFICDVYTEAFGVTCDNNESSDNGNFPIYVATSINHASNYYNKFKNLDGDERNVYDNGNYLIYYQKNTMSDDGKVLDTNDYYVYDFAPKTSTQTKEKYNNLVELLKPGDIVVYTGHSMLVYDVVTRSDGTRDALLMQATQSPFISSRSVGTSRLSYNIFPSNIKNLQDLSKSIGYDYKAGTSDKVNESLWKNYPSDEYPYYYEGGIKLAWLSSVHNGMFISDNGYFGCYAEEECAIIRPFYNNDKDGEKIAKFKYNISNDTKYNKSMLRLEYPGLLIEKTVDVGDNNSVYLGDELTYNIKITNKSSIGNKNKTFSFYIDEKIDQNLVEKVGDISGNSDNNGNVKVTCSGFSCKVENLGVDKSVILSYKVKVKNNVKNVDKVILSTGNFYGIKDGVKKNDITISTGTVKNKIYSKNIVKSFTNCYNTVNSKIKKNELKIDEVNILKFVDELYKCVYKTDDLANLFNKSDFKFNNFNFSNLFDKKIFIINNARGITFDSNLDSNGQKIFKDMILNNYWSGMIAYDEDNNGTIDNYNQARFDSNDTSVNYRNMTINSSDFQDGDILIYYINYNDNENMNYSSGCKNSNGVNINTCLYVTPEEYRYTKENGLYAYVYVDGKFVGNNYKTNADYVRNEFTYDYYKNTDGLTIGDNLYTGNGKILSGYRSKYLEYANYQTLYDKDYYVILRPSVIIKEITDMSLTKIDYELLDGELDLTGGKLKIVFDDESVETLDLLSGDISVKIDDDVKVGKNVITVEYKGYSKSFEINAMTSDDDNSNNDDDGNSNNDDDNSNNDDDNSNNDDDNSNDDDYSNNNDNSNNNDDSNVDNNPETGGISILLILMLGFCVGVFSIWYFGRYFKRKSI